MRLEPFGQRIVVKRLTKDQVGSIIMPESVKKTSLEGEVVETGKECEFVKTGDKIIFGRYSGFELPLDGDYKGCLVMNEEDILARMNP